MGTVKSKEHQARQDTNQAQKDKKKTRSTAWNGMKSGRKSVLVLAQKT